MAHCENNNRLSRWLDGESAPEEQKALEEHLRTCSDCKREMERLRQLSRLLRAAAPSMPAGVMGRLHRNVTRLNERLIIRWAEQLTAAAASVLICCVAWAMSASPLRESAAATTPFWEIAAITSPAVVEQTSAEQEVAGWVIEDLSSENGYE